MKTLVEGEKFALQLSWLLITIKNLIKRPNLGGQSRLSETFSKPFDSAVPFGCVKESDKQQIKGGRYQSKNEYIRKISKIWNEKQMCFVIIEHKWSHI